MRRQLATALAALGLALIGTSGPTWAGTAVGTGTGCDDLVVDRTGSGASDVATPVARRLDASRDVFARARLIDDAPDGDLDAWAEEELAGCPSWQTGDGLPRTDLLLLVVDLDARVIGSYFGDALAVRLEPSVNVVHDRMRPALVAGQPGEALRDGLAAYGDELGISTSAPRSVVPLAVGGGVVLVGGAGAVVLTRRRRRQRVQTTAAQARTAAMGAWYDLESRWETIQAGVTVSTQSVHADDGVAATVEQEADEAERAMAGVRELLLGVPDPAEVTTQQAADEAAEAWSRVGERIAAVVTEVDEVEAAVAALQEAKQTAPARVDEADAAVAEAVEAIRLVGQQEIGGVALQAPAAAALADDARAGATAARTAMEQGRHGDAVVAARAAATRAAEAAARAAQVPSLARELPQRADELAKQAREAVRLAMESRNALTTLRSRWRRTVWDDISDAPDRANDLAEQAADLADTAAKAAGPAVQDWDAALAGLETAEALLQEAAELIAAPRERDTEAQTQARAAGDLVQRAREAAASSGDLLDSAGKVDLSIQRNSLDAARRQIEKAAALLEGKPDPIRAAQIGADALTLVERVGTGARQAIDAWQRDRDRAHETVRSARSELTRAERDRPRSRRFTTDLRRADDLLKSAEDLLESDPTAAADDAQAALEIARGVVRDKRRERDLDRDQWRAPGGSSVGGAIGILGATGGSRRRTSTPSRPRAVTPRRAPSPPSPPKPRRGSFGGGGTSKF